MEPYGIYASDCSDSVDSPESGPLSGRIGPERR